MKNVVMLCVLMAALVLCGCKEQVEKKLVVEQARFFTEGEDTSVVVVARGVPPLNGTFCLELNRVFMVSDTLSTVDWTNYESFNGAICTFGKYLGRVVDPRVETFVVADTFYAVSGGGVVYLTLTNASRQLAVWTQWSFPAVVGDTVQVVEFPQNNFLITCGTKRQYAYRILP